MNKKKIRYPIIVEGKYDKNTLSQLFDTTVISVGGFSIFNSVQKQSLIRKIAENGIILLTDSDAGGKQIRSFLMGILPKEKIFNAYIPKIAGKERRKKAPSRAGLLGVEGMGREELEKALAPFVVDDEKYGCEAKSGKMITKVDFFVDKLSGADNSSLRREMICRELDLPDDMSANALLEALNLLIGYDEYRAMCKRLFCEEENK